MRARGGPCLKVYVSRKSLETPNVKHTFRSTEGSGSIADFLQGGTYLGDITAINRETYDGLSSARQDHQSVP